jgi:hypothetical protein
MTQQQMDWSAPVEPPRIGKAAQLAALFKARPNCWIDGMELARIGGQYAWRTRVSNLRERRFGSMHIENRIRLVEVEPGRTVKVSEYRYVQAGEQTERVA